MWRGRWGLRTAVSPRGRSSRPPVCQACRTGGGLPPEALFLTRGIGLPRRYMGSRRRIRAADRLRHPRGVGVAAEAEGPGEEMGAKLLKRQQGLMGQGELCVHGAKHRVAHLTD